MFAFFSHLPYISYWQVCDNFIHPKKHQQLGGFTLPETNIAPENGWLEDEFSFGMAYFQGHLLVSGVYVSFREVLLVHQVFLAQCLGGVTTRSNHPVTTPAFLGLDVLFLFWGGSWFPVSCRTKILFNVIESGTMMIIP